jgi:tetratricopeptide (TPR) repeat protein
MRLRHIHRFGFGMLTLFATLLSIACNQTSANGRSDTASADSGKIPITTKSEEARREFLQGRELSDKLLANDSLQHYDKALALDPEFALAESARANASPTAKDFFEHLNKAVAAADKASEGEKLVILANQAGANGEAAKQKDLLEKLAGTYPNDERAHFMLGTYYFGQQDYGAAVDHFKKATEIAPNYSPAYNILGYAYRQQADYANAENAFKKYIELIPNDPNPYDSYAELLLRMGKFDDSITQYRKALSEDGHFMPSHVGIAADLMYLNKPQEAAAELQKMASQARNDGELRTALFAMTVLSADGGHFDQALQQMDQQFAVAEKKKDAAAMAGDLQAKGNILLETKKYDEARKTFERSLQITQDSDLSQEIKDNAKRQHHYNLTLVALGKKDATTAKSEADEFRKGAEASNNVVQTRLSHELQGIIALDAKDYDHAIVELQQANQQNPRNLYRLSLAYAGKGDNAKAQEFAAKAGSFNPLPQLNYAFIRTKAQKASGRKA